MNRPAISEGAAADDGGPADGPAAGDVVQRDVVIPNPQGLHMRPVLRFVDLAAQFDAQVTVGKDDHRVDGKSPMEMMLLEGTCGSTLRLEASGAQARDAIEALAGLIEAGFDEMDEPPADGSASEGA